eukprot:CAMPEP_0182452692 /NCGR_PEP_ID=MMETSP1319-20130603/41_1 /TAXON_ID=172717 /ORGANISM="Bolidomonas pacifica, Strain RCC208" /LENGTH=132 /DNA_ID=CAMNT_0024650541 /DNA_START=66 /DNA_END=464 /DNA_ORIENTATION=-
MMMGGANMDPMAGIGQANNASTDGTSGTGRKMFNAYLASTNALHVSDARAYMSLVAGAVAGVTGLTNLKGACAFLIMHFVTGAAVVVFKFNGKIDKYTSASGLFSFLTQELQKCSLSFILFWTLFYGLVYLF